jgi:hypothetical protein
MAEYLWNFVTAGLQNHPFAYNNDRYENRNGDPDLFSRSPGTVSYSYEQLFRRPTQPAEV